MNQLEKDIRAMSFKDAYNFFMSIEEVENEEIYERIRYGFIISMDIHDYFSNNYFKKSKTHIIIYGGQQYLQQDVNTDIEMRIRALKNYLLTRFNEGSLSKSR